jgi:hypothetical protein
MALSDKILGELQAFQATHQLEPRQIVYWLVSFTWGYAKRQGWEHRHIASYALMAWEKCDQLARENGLNAKGLIDRG